MAKNNNRHSEQAMELSEQIRRHTNTNQSLSNTHAPAQVMEQEQVQVLEQVQALVQALVQEQELAQESAMQEQALALAQEASPR